MAGGKALWLQFLRKANFILLQRNTFYLTTKLAENIEKVNSLSIPIKSNH